MPRPTFWSRVDKSAGAEACWPWTGAKTLGDRLRYGRTSMNNRGTYAHRFAYADAYGPIPAGMRVLHSCDNPPCCNPAHLRLGTHAENMRDMTGRGRAARLGGTARGSRNSQALLTEDGVREIRAAHARGETQRSIALRFGVSTSAINSVIRRRLWTWVEDQPLAYASKLDEYQTRGA